MLWVFDINETLLDLDPLDEVFSRHTGLPGLRTEWFDLLIRSAIVLTATGRYQSFAALGAECARAVVRGHGGQFGDEAVADLAATMRRLPAHPDVPEALVALRSQGHRLVALGNSPLEVINAQLSHAQLPLDAAYSVEQAGVLKPAPGAYHFPLRAEDVPPDQAVMVAAHDWDVAGAKAVGMRTVFLTRGHGRPLPPGPDPDATIRDLRQAHEVFHGPRPT